MKKTRYYFFVPFEHFQFISDLNFNATTIDFDNSNSIYVRLLQGPLKIWTEHSKFPLQGRGDSKTPIALLRPNFFFFKCENTFLSI